MSKKLESLSGSNAPTCSPSSLTPETDKEWHATLDWCNQRDEIQDPCHVALANLCEKLECDRNQTRGALARLCRAVARRMMPDDPTPEDRMELRKAFEAASSLLENVPSVAQSHDQ